MYNEPRSVSPEPRSAELSHTAIGQWGGVIAGVFAGFAATVVLATLGTALGLTAGTAALDEPRTTGSGAGAIGAGVVVWLVLTAAIVGIIGGLVLARTSRPDRAFHAVTLGVVTWTGGVLLAAFLAAPAAGGLTSGVGASAGAASAYFTPSQNGSVQGRRTEPDNTRPLDASTQRGTPLTEEERTRLRVAAEDAARAVTLAAWAALVAQIVSLLATMGAAKWQRRRIVAREPIGYVVPAPGV